ncbi:F-box only protein 30-like isoform X1 [Mytilus trossulus]|uniref:F-box only protein 30-like isoform X1 n=2 Tax=Mytilus trossulus TaxID=6551 RepID=UPI003006C360
MNNIYPYISRNDQRRYKHYQQRETAAENLKAMEDMTFSLSLLHAHCESCVNKKCNITPDQLSSCEMTDCENMCGHRFHSCKKDEHELICSQQKVPCINHSNGCPLEMARCKRASHLSVCPASVQRCVVEWNRWPMHSKEECLTTPLPLDSQHVKCTQLDVALALRDQRMLVQSMKIPRKIRKIFQNSLTQKYPSVPLEQNRSSSIDSDNTVDDTSGATSDEDTPWGSQKCPLGLQKTVVNQLHKASKQTADSVSATLDLFSHHFGKAGLKHLTQKLQGITETEEAKTCGQQTDETENDKIKNSLDDISSENISEPKSCDLSESADDCMVISVEDVYTKDIKLHNLLGVSLDIECISKYIPKPKKMYTFLCAQDFRRDEYPWHFKNVHNDIHCGLNGMMEFRCPLAYMGCDYSCQKLSPLEPKGKIIHSALQESFGLAITNAEDQIKEEQMEEVQCKKCSVIESDKRKLREATPEITTSQKYDSNIKILPKYQCNRLCDSASSFPSTDGQIYLDCLPFEVLQHIVVFLDSFSLCNLSLTSKLLRDVCASRLDQKGMVIPVWQARGEGVKPSWTIAYWKWCFSTSFTPVRKWQYHTGNGLFEHLKICPYNQENSKNIKTEPFCPASELMSIKTAPEEKNTTKSLLKLISA